MTAPLRCLWMLTDTGRSRPWILWNSGSCGKVATTGARPHLELCYSSFVVWEAAPKPGIIKNECFCKLYSQKATL